MLGTNVSFKDGRSVVTGTVVDKVNVMHENVLQDMYVVKAEGLKAVEGTDEKVKAVYAYTVHPTAILEIAEK